MISDLLLVVSLHVRPSLLLSHNGGVKEPQIADLCSKVLNNLKGENRLINSHKML